VWQTLRAELYPQGLEIVTVDLETLGLAAALPFIEAARPTHPSLIDAGHLLDELFGVVNVPTGVWIDEQGVIVRPPEPAHTPNYPATMKLIGRISKVGIVAETGRFPDVRERGFEANRLIADTIRDQIITELQTSIPEEETYKMGYEGDKYFVALRDWITKGRNSRYVLTPEEVLRRSRPRSLEEALGAAHFELGQHLYRQGKTGLAVAHFKESHWLQPNNWTYRRQAYSLADPFQGPTAIYESDYGRDLNKPRTEKYYPPLEID
jgi:hypothetical protein